jgi:large subunit ribosomal protein L10
LIRSPSGLWQPEEDAVNREEKATTVATLHERFKKATVTVLATSQGLNVTKLQQLRRAVKQAGGEYKVAKNTFTRRALQGTGFSGLHDLLQGPAGLIFGYADPIAVTKALVRFSEENEKLSIKAAVLDGKVLEPATVSELAKMPAREVLLAMLLRLMQAPAVQLLRTMQEPGGRLVRVLDRIRERGEEKS